MPVKPPLNVRILRALTFPLVVLVALVLWVEEWLWEPLGQIMRWLGQLPLIRNLESLIRRAPPYFALACFAIPIVSLLPFKIAGLWLIGKGFAIPGLFVFLSAKIVGTALGARVLALTKPALMTLPWFARLWDRFHRAKVWVYARVTEHPVWRGCIAVLKAIRKGPRTESLWARLQLRQRALHRLKRRQLAKFR